MGMPRWSSLLPDDHPASGDHVRRCPDCRGRLETERRYLASLRQVHVPSASHALQERLLERTQYLAAQAELAERTAAQPSRARCALRLGLTALTGAAACAAALAVTAYAVAGDPGPRATAGNGAAAFVRTAPGAAPARPAPGASVQTAAHSDDPLDRLGRGLLVVVGASGRP